MFCSDKINAYRKHLASRIPETLLHELWKRQSFHTHELYDVHGAPIDILHMGQHNMHEGPDFLAGSMRYKGKIWHGAIEMHVKASDWMRHGHQYDPNYHQVMLHVVYENDEEIVGHDGNPIPCLELQPYLNDMLLRRLSKQTSLNHQLPCHFFLDKIMSQLVYPQPDWLWEWLEVVYEERLRAKSIKCLEVLTGGHFDWHKIGMAELLFSLMGPSNKEVAQAFVAHLHFDVLQKLKTNIHDLLAYLLGTAGFIRLDSQEAYAIKLAQQHAFILKKFGLPTPSKFNWHFKGVRPSNFPSLRMIQWAYLLYEHPNLVQEILHAKNKKELNKLFEIHPDRYWYSHYIAGQESKQHSMKIGSATIFRLVINSVVPLQLAHQYSYQKAGDYARTLALLQQLPAETNALVRAWKKLGIKARHAADSQALIHLSKHYCKPKKCLSCTIGLQCLAGKD